MAYNFHYKGKDGRPKNPIYESGRDTSLMIPCRRSVFSVVRSRYLDDDGNVRYEFFVKCPNANATKMVYGGKLYGGVSNLYSTRPSSRNAKLKFDSDRTSVYPYFSICDSHTELNETSGNWTYAGGVEKFGDGSFSLYGSIFDYDGTYYTTDRYGRLQEQHVTSSTMMFGTESYSKKQVYEILVSAGIARGDEVSYSVKFAFNEKIADVREWKIVSSVTPDKNTYQIVIEDKYGNLLDIKTSEFGKRIGDAIGEYSAMFDDDVNNETVVDDFVIRISN